MKRWKSRSLRKLILKQLQLLLLDTVGRLGTGIEERPQGCLYPGTEWMRLQPVSLHKVSGIASFSLATKCARPWAKRAGEKPLTDLSPIRFSRRLKLIYGQRNLPTALQMTIACSKVRYEQENMISANVDSLLRIYFLVMEQWGGLALFFILVRPFLNLWPVLAPVRLYFDFRDS